MENAVGTGSMSADEKRWSAICICLYKILAPNLKSAINIEFENWYNLLTQPPTEIDKQVYPEYIRTISPSKFPLQYENINCNNVHKASSTYDYAVKDPLSLAKLFLHPFMGKFASFDQMDLSAALSIMCEAGPFVNCGAAFHASRVRSEIRNKWARSDFSIWTYVRFRYAIEEMERLVKTTNLSEVLKEEICRDLQSIKNRGIYDSLCFEVRWGVAKFKAATNSVVQLVMPENSICLYV